MVHYGTGCRSLMSMMDGGRGGRSKDGPRLVFSCVACQLVCCHQSTSTQAVFLRRRKGSFFRAKDAIKAVRLPVKYKGNSNINKKKKKKSKTDEPKKRKRHRHKLHITHKVSLGLLFEWQTELNGLKCVCCCFAGWLVERSACKSHRFGVP